VHILFVEQFLINRTMFQPQEPIVTVESEREAVPVVGQAEHLHRNDVAFLDSRFKIDNPFFSFGCLNVTVRDIGDFEAEQVADMGVFHLLDKTPISIPRDIHPGESGISAERLAGFCANPAPFHDKSDFGVDRHVDLEIVRLEMEPTGIRNQVPDGFQDGQGSVGRVGTVMGKQILGADIIRGPVFAELDGVGQLLDDPLRRSQFLRNFALYPSLQSFDQFRIEDCQKIGAMAHESPMRQEEAFTIQLVHESFKIEDRQLFTRTGLMFSR